MARKTGRKKVIILVIVVLLLAGGGAAYYGVRTGFFASHSNNSNDTKTQSTYKDGLEKTKTKVNELIASGDKQSIKEADAIVDAEVSAANESGNDAYIVDANLAKAALLINTDRAQEAVDGVLSSVDKKYASNDTYKSDIYVNLSLAYTKLGDTAKADEYLNQISGRGGN
jgi:uncharacterized protein with LGFP repeats